MLRRAIFVILLCAGSLPHASADEPTLARHVAPILYQLGCSAGTCHGAFSGKGGFRLALFAGNPEADHLNLRGGFGRRLDFAQPERSLLLLKPTGAVGHGGGVRLHKGSWQYDVLRRWIAAGAVYRPEQEAKIVALRVEPATFVLAGKPQPLKVFARFSDQSEADVTLYARFESLESGIAAVDGAGNVAAQRAGDVAVLAHYAGQIAFATALIPGPSIESARAETPGDSIDRFLSARLQQLNIVAAPRCGDLEFLRRAHLDSIGILPTPAEVRAFLADTSADKRARLIDRLLTHPLHAALWAGKLCDMVGADDRFLGDGVYQFHDWFRNKLESNTSWDRIAYGVLCATAADERTPERILEDQKRATEEQKKAKGKKPPPPPPGSKPWLEGYAARQTLDVFYSSLIHLQERPNKLRIVDSRKLALRVAHTFLGVRLECAQCHKHPYDRWSQADFLSFAMIFAHVHLGSDPQLKAHKVNLNGIHVEDTPCETFLDPETQQTLTAKILGGVTLAPGLHADPRRELWQWLTRPDNPYFAPALVNRVWEHYLGRGLVEPADAQSAANPPSHPAVLLELVRDFIAHKYDLRHLHRRILNTLAYQRDWRTNASNARDERNYSHRHLRRLTAEQALDAIAQVTGTPIKLPKRFATPREGQRAVEIAVSRAGGDDGYVLQIFGRPLRVQNCDCERSAAASLSQTLYLFNDEKLLGKIQAEKGRLQGLVEATADDRKLLAELYLLALTRLPTEEETTRSLAHVRAAPARLAGYQDILWSLMNCHDFIINH